MFTYCLNEPANRTDACGTISATIYGDEYDFLDHNIFEHGGGGVGATLAIGAVVFSYKISEKDQSIIYKDIKKQNDKHPGEYIVHMTLLTRGE